MVTTDVQVLADIIGMGLRGDELALPPALDLFRALKAINLLGRLRQLDRAGMLRHATRGR